MTILLRSTIWFLLCLLSICTQAGEYQTLIYRTDNEIFTFSTKPCGKKGWLVNVFIQDKVTIGCWYKQGNQVVINAGEKYLIDANELELAVNRPNK